MLLYTYCPALKPIINYFTQNQLRHCFARILLQTLQLAIYDINDDPCSFRSQPVVTERTLVLSLSSAGKDEENVSERCGRYWSLRAITGPDSASLSYPVLVRRFFKFAADSAGVNASSTGCNNFRGAPKSRWRGKPTGKPMGGVCCGVKLSFPVSEVYSDSKHG